MSEFLEVHESESVPSGVLDGDPLDRTVPVGPSRSPCPRFQGPSFLNGLEREPNVDNMEKSAALSIVKVSGLMRRSPTSARLLLATPFGWRHKARSEAVDSAERPL